MGPCGRRPVAKPIDRSLRPHPPSDDEQLTGTAPVERVLLESVPVYPSDSPFTPFSRVRRCAGRLFERSPVVVASSEPQRAIILAGHLNLAEFSRAACAERWPTSPR